MAHFLLTKAAKQTLHAERAKDVESKSEKKSFLPRNANTQCVFRLSQEVCDWLFSLDEDANNAGEAAREFILREYRKTH